MFPAVAPEEIYARKAQNARDTRESSRPAGVPRTFLSAFEDPLAIGSLLILCPPIGLAIIWKSRNYSSDARWALTVMTALTMCLSTAVLIAAIAMR